MGSVRAVRVTIFLIAICCETCFAFKTVADESGHEIFNDNSDEHLVDQVDHDFLIKTKEKLNIVPPDVDHINIGEVRQEMSNRKEIEISDFENILAAEQPKTRGRSQTRTRIIRQVYEPMNSTPSQHRQYQLYPTFYPNNYPHSNLTGHNISLWQSQNNLKNNTHSNIQVSAFSYKSTNSTYAYPSNKSTYSSQNNTQMKNNFNTGYPVTNSRYLLPTYGPNTNNNNFPPNYPTPYQNAYNNSNSRYPLPTFESNTIFPSNYPTPNQNAYNNSNSTYSLPTYRPNINNNNFSSNYPTPNLNAHNNSNSRYPLPTYGSNTNFPSNYPASNQNAYNNSNSRYSLPTYGPNINNNNFSSNYPTPNLNANNNSNSRYLLPTYGSNTNFPSNYPTTNLNAYNNSNSRYSLPTYGPNINNNNFPSNYPTPNLNAHNNSNSRYPLPTYGSNTNFPSNYPAPYQNAYNNSNSRFPLPPYRPNTNNNKFKSSYPAFNLYSNNSNWYIQGYPYNQSISGSLSLNSGPFNSSTNRTPYYLQPGGYPGTNYSDDTRFNSPGYKLGGPYNPSIPDRPSYNIDQQHFYYPNPTAQDPTKVRPENFG